LQTPVKNETADQLGLGLQGQLSVLRSRGLQPTVVQIRRIKKIYRAVKNGLPWT